MHQMATLMTIKISNVENQVHSFIILTKSNSLTE
jgi:hypothetical protein